MRLRCVRLRGKHDEAQRTRQTQHAAHHPAMHKFHFIQPQAAPPSVGPRAQCKRCCSGLRSMCVYEQRRVPQESDDHRATSAEGRRVTHKNKLHLQHSPAPFVRRRLTVRREVQLVQGAEVVHKVAAGFKRPHNKFPQCVFAYAVVRAASDVTMTMTTPTKRPPPSTSGQGRTRRPPSLPRNRPEGSSRCRASGAGSQQFRGAQSWPSPRRTSGSQAGAR